MIKEDTLGKKFLNLRERKDEESVLTEVSLISNHQVSQKKFKAVINNLMHGLLHYKLGPQSNILILGDNNFIIKAFTMAAANLGMNLYISPQNLSIENCAEIINENDITSIFLADNGKFLDLINSINEVSKIKCIITLNSLSELQKKRIRNLVFFYTLDQIESQGVRENKNNPDSYSMICKAQNPKANIFSFCYPYKNKVKIFSFNSISILQGLKNCHYFLESLNLKNSTIFSFFPWGHPISILISILNLYWGKNIIYLDQQNLKKDLEKISEKIKDSRNKRLILLTEPTELAAISSHFKSVFDDFPMALKIKSFHQQIKSNLIKNKIIKEELYDHTATEVKKLFSKDSFFSQLKVVISLEDPTYKQNANPLLSTFSSSGISLLRGLVSPEIFGPILINPLKGEKIDSYGLPWGDIEIQKIAKNKVKIKSYSLCQTAKGQPNDSDELKKQEIDLPLKLDLRSDGYYY